MKARLVLLMLCLACVFYTGFVYRFSDPKTELKAPGIAALKGKAIWQEKNCQSCHQLYGLGGYMGPDLTNVAAKGHAYLNAFMKKGTTRMPDFHLSDSEISELTAFLQWVNSSGQSKVPDSLVHWTGSYSINP
jgi:nitric oxide reductase subunit C